MAKFSFHTDKVTQQSYTTGQELPRPVFLFRGTPKRQIILFPGKCEYFVIRQAANVEEQQKVKSKNSFVESLPKPGFSLYLSNPPGTQEGQGLEGLFYRIIVSYYYYKYCLVLIITAKCGKIQAGSGKANACIK